MRLRLLSGVLSLADSKIAVFLVPSGRFVFPNFLKKVADSAR